jgi:hypothetical protein
LTIRHYMCNVIRHAAFIFRAQTTFWPPKFHFHQNIDFYFLT